MTDQPTDPSAAKAEAQRVTSAAVRTIALIEALKGALVLLAGIGALSFIHRDVQAMAELIVRHSHLNPAHHYPRIFLEFASHVDDARLARLAMLAAGYALLRFVEAYGLSRERRWAEWFAAISGGVYIPLEVQHLVHRVSWVSVLIVLINLAVVGVMVFALLRHRAADPASIPVP